MFTNAGLEYFWRCILGEETGTLAKAEIVVGNGQAPFSPDDRSMSGDEIARRPLDEYPGFGWNEDAALDMPDDEETLLVITLRATFGEGVANFEWRERGVVVGDILIDRTVSDQGRKASGAVWEAEATLSLRP